MRSALARAARSPAAEAAQARSVRAGSRRPRTNTASQAVTRAVARSAAPAPDVRFGASRRCGCCSKPARLRCSSASPRIPGHARASPTPPSKGMARHDRSRHSTRAAHVPARARLYRAGGADAHAWHRRQYRALRRRRGRAAAAAAVPRRRIASCSSSIATCAPACRSRTSRSATSSICRARQQSFEAFAGYGGFQSTLIGDGEPVRVEGVSAHAGGLLTLLGAPAGDGPRLRRPTTCVKARRRWSIVSHELWRTELGSDPQILSRSIQLGPRAGWWSAWRRRASTSRRRSRPT